MGAWAPGLCGNFKVVDEFTCFINNNTNIKKKKPSVSGNIYNVKYAGRVGKTAADLLYKHANIYLDRKMDLYKKYGEWCND